MRNIASRFECRSDFRRMMGVVVDDLHIVFRGADDVEASLSAVIAAQSVDDDLWRDTQRMTGGKRG